VVSSIIAVWSVINNVRNSRFYSKVCMMENWLLVRDVKDLELMEAHPEKCAGDMFYRDKQILIRSTLMFRLTRHLSMYELNIDPTKHRYWPQQKPCDNSG